MESKSGCGATWTGILHWEDTGSNRHQIQIHLSILQEKTKVFDSWPKDLQVQLTSKETINKIVPHIGTFFTADLYSQAEKALNLLTAELFSGKIGLAVFTSGFKNGVCLAVTVSEKILKGIICIWDFHSNRHCEKYSLCLAELVHEIQIDWAQLHRPGILNKDPVEEMYNFTDRSTGNYNSRNYYGQHSRWDQPSNSRNYQGNGGGSRFNQTFNNNRSYPRESNQPIQGNSRAAQSPAEKFSNLGSEIPLENNSGTSYDPKSQGHKITGKVRLAHNPNWQSLNPIRRSRSPVRQSPSPVTQSHRPAGRSRSPTRRSRSPTRRSRSPTRQSPSPSRSKYPNDQSWRSARKVQAREHQRNEQSKCPAKPDLQKPITQPCNPSVSSPNDQVLSNTRPNLQDINNSGSKFSKRYSPLGVQSNKEKVKHVADTTQGEFASRSNQSTQSVRNNNSSQQMKLNKIQEKPTKEDITIFKMEQSPIVETKRKVSATISSGQDNVPHSSQDLPSTSTNMLSTTQDVKSEQASELEGYMAALQELLKCYKCKNWVTPEHVFSCLCSVACIKCATEVPNCPGCEVPITHDYKYSLFYFRISSVIPHPCPNEGCFSIVKPEDEHAASCKFKPFNCFICHIPVPQVSAREHFQHVHPQHLLLQEGVNENILATQFWLDSKTDNKMICCFVQERFVTITLYKFEDEQKDAQFVIEKNLDDNDMNVTVKFAFQKNGWDCARTSPTKKGLKTWVEVPLDIVREWLFGKCKLDISVTMKQKRKVNRNANKGKKLQTSKGLIVLE